MGYKVKVKHSKGFMLIEILISMALFSMLTSIVFSIFNMKTKIIDSASKKIELQQQAQYIMSFLEERIINSEGIEYIEDIHGFSKEETNDRLSINKIIIRDSSVSGGKGYVFNLLKDKEFEYNNLKYGKYKRKYSEKGTIEVGNYIKTIETSPIPSAYTYKEAAGIVLKIIFIIDKESIEITESFCFRNSRG
mgnify:CR=1 FL=1